MLAALALAPVVWVAPPDLKLRPSALPGTDQAASLDAGRGECADFQIAVRAGPEGLPDVTADAGSFRPALGAHLSLAREVTLHLDRPSGPDGATGDWPDPLIPQVDAYVGERRNAFPVSLAAGQLLAIWAEVCVPQGAPPGERRASVVLESAGTGFAEVPVVLRVHRFAIPATSTLPTSFGLSLPSLLAQHHPATPAEADALLRRYAVAALRHRLSLHALSLRPPPFTRGPGGLKLDFTGYDRELGPLLDGTAVRSGARFTSTDVRLAPGLATDAEKIAYLRATAEHLRSRGWLDRAFLYAADEPSPPDFPKVVALARLAHEADPELRVLVTVPLQRALEGSVDIWTVNVNCLVVKDDPAEFCPLRAPFADYAPRLRGGESLWWYLSCSSHGCGGAIPRSARDYFRGWPDLVIDVPGSRNRAMGPLAYRYGIEGELYYDTVGAYRDGDPWRSVYRFGGNGDGTLFYPGTPDRIGGRTDVPVESIRLELVRDGLQDFEELALARKLGEGAFADRLAAEWVPSATEVDVTPARRIALRAQLLERLDVAWREPVVAAGPSR
ncbi:MAG TPA: DUF4091 domain-containing protein [Myxococcales bacterium]|nr:DUF4091 domain-containing protein [Myxococcales bacterium]